MSVVFINFMLLHWINIIKISHYLKREKYIINIADTCLFEIHVYLKFENLK